MAISALSSGTVACWVSLLSLFDLLGLSFPTCNAGRGEIDLPKCVRLYPFGPLHVGATGKHSPQTLPLPGGQRAQGPREWAGGPGRCPPPLPHSCSPRSWPPGTPVGAGQDGDHVHALPGTLNALTRRRHHCRACGYVSTAPRPPSASPALPTLPASASAEALALTRSDMCVLVQTSRVHMCRRRVSPTPNPPSADAT